MVAEKREVKIRRMDEADLSKVNEIAHVIFGKERVSTWLQAAEAHWKAHRPTLNFVAETNGETIGFLLGGIRRARRMVPLIGWIDIMGVHPDYQRERVGQGLVQAFREECGRSSATVAVNIKKNDKLLRKFFSKLGFREGDSVIFER